MFKIISCVSSIITEYKKKKKKKKKKTERERLKRILYLSVF